MTTQSGTTNKEKAVAIGKIVNKIRTTKGWALLDPDDQNITIACYMEILNAAGARGDSYNELYKLAAAHRSQKILDGRDAPDWSPELLAAFVPQANKMMRDRALDEIAQKRGLPKPDVKQAGDVDTNDGVMIALAAAAKHNQAIADSIIRIREGLEKRPTNTAELIAFVAKPMAEAK